MNEEQAINTLKHQIAELDEKILEMEDAGNTSIELYRLKEEKKRLEKELSDLYPDMPA